MDQEQLITLLKAFAANNKIPFEELVQDFQEESPENQQAFIEHIMKEMNLGEQQPQQEQMMQSGGIPVNPNGYYELDPLETPEVMIPSGDITMKGINYPIDAYDGNTGEFLERMKPNKNYKFNTNKVLEKPVIAQTGKTNYKSRLKSLDFKLDEIKKEKEAYLKSIKDKITKEEYSAIEKEYQRIENEIQNKKSKFDLNLKQVENIYSGNDPISNFRNKLSGGKYFEKLYTTLNDQIKDIELLENDLNEVVKENYDFSYGYNKPFEKVSLVARKKDLPKYTKKSTIKVDENINKNQQNVDLSQPIFEGWNYEPGKGYKQADGSYLQKPNTAISKSRFTSTTPKETSNTVSTTPNKSLKNVNVSSIENPLTTDKSLIYRGYENEDRAPEILPSVNITQEEVNQKLEDLDNYNKQKEAEEAAKSRFLGKFDSNPPMSAYREMLNQSMSRIQEPYRGTPDISYGEIPLVELDPIINNIVEQEYGALQNVDTSTASGRAYAAQIASNTQKAVMDTSNQVNAQNQQIKAQNELNKINTFNQMEANRVAADRQYVDELQRSEAVRDTMRLNAKVYQDEILGNEKKANNNLTATLMNLPQIQLKDLGDGTKEAYLDTTYKPTYTKRSNNVITLDDGEYVEIEGTRKGEKRLVKIKEPSMRLGGKFKYKKK